MITLDVTDGISVTGRYGLVSLTPTSTLPKIRKQVSNFLPAFIENDYPLFAEFVEAFVSYLESEGSGRHTILSLSKNVDIDTSAEEYLQILLRETLPDIPEATDGNKRFISKHISEFYRSRGNEDSVRFLFRLLSGQEIDFHYPRTETLKLSSGVWEQERTLKIEMESGNPFDLIGKQIQGQINKANAFVGKVNPVRVGTREFFEVRLLRQSIEGEFLPEETITDFDTRKLRARIIPVISDIEILDGGSGYIEGQRIEAQEGVILEVNEVTSTGGIKGFDILSSGFNVSSNTLTIPPETTEAFAQGIIGGLSTYKGNWRNRDNLGLSALRKLPDGDYYQQFSYVIRVALGLAEYEDIVKRLVHPAGFKLFGEVNVIHELEATSIDATEPAAQQIICQLVDKSVFMSLDEKQSLCIESYSHESLGNDYEFFDYNSRFHTTTPIEDLGEVYISEFSNDNYYPDFDQTAEVQVSQI